MLVIIGPILYLLAKSFNTKQMVTIIMYNHVLLIGYRNYVYIAVSAQQECTIVNMFSFTGI